MFVVNLPEAPGTIPCINSSCFFILSFKKHLLSQCGSKTASACKTKEAVSINVNEHKFCEIVLLNPQSLISCPGREQSLGNLAMSLQRAICKWYLIFTDITEWWWTRVDLRRATQQIRCIPCFIYDSTLRLIWKWVTSLLCAQTLSHVRLSATPWKVSQPGSSVHGIAQAKILEWVAISSSKGSS